VSSSKGHSSKQVRKKEMTWMSKEQMDVALGPIKAASWRESKKLQTRDDIITGKSGEFDVEYYVPKFIEEWTDEDIQTLFCQAEGQMQEGDLKNLQELANGQPVSASDRQPNGNIKHDGEEPNPLVVLQQNCQKITDNPRKAFDEVTDKIVTLRRIETNGHSQKAETTWAGPLMVEMKKILPKFTRASKTLERMLSEEVDADEIPKLVHLLKELDAAYNNCTMWAGRFGIMEAPKAKKARRK
jgi:hypothetical protein